MTPPQLLTPAQLAEIRARADDSDPAKTFHQSDFDIPALLSHIDALSQANAEQAGEIDRLQRETSYRPCDEIGGCPDRSTCNDCSIPISHHVAAQATEIAALRKQLAEADAVVFDVAACLRNDGSMLSTLSVDDLERFEADAVERHRARMAGQEGEGR
jgi:hypothetical protein